MSAGDLQRDDMLVGPAGLPVETELEELNEATEVDTFNVTIADVATYFVVIGSVAVLVHNADLPPFDEPLFWVFGKTIDVRVTDTDGKSVWRTKSRADVDRMFEIRVKNGRSKADPHLWFKADDPKAAKLKLNKSPANVVANPSTPGEITTAELVKAEIQHYSLRPEGAVDIPEGISYDELQKREDLHLNKEQMTDLTERSESLKTTEMKPRELKC